MSTKKSARPGRPEPKGTGSATFGAKVRAAMAVLRWNQTELAVRSGLTQRAVYGIEAEINRPRKASESQILSAVSATGLRIDDTSDGGFTLTVPRTYLRSGGKKRAK